MIADASKKRDDDIHKFPAKLVASIASYDKDVKAIYGKKNAMAGNEGADAIARNKKSVALAKKNEALTKQRGKENQAVKSKLIW